MLLDMAVSGDTIITLEVSRLSRSTQQLCEILDSMKEKHLRLMIVGSITIDCRNGEVDLMSKVFLEMSGVIAELELSMIRARVRSRMQNARDKGRKIGRPQTTKDNIPANFYKHYPSYAAGNMNVSELARICGLSRPTVYKYQKTVVYAWPLSTKKEAFTIVTAITNKSEHCYPSLILIKYRMYTRGIYELCSSLG